MEISIGFPMTNPGKETRRFGKKKCHKNLERFIGVIWPCSFRSTCEAGPGLSGLEGETPLLLVLSFVKGWTGRGGLVLCLNRRLQGWQWVSACISVTTLTNVQITKLTITKRYWWKYPDVAKVVHYFRPGIGEKFVKVRFLYSLSEVRGKSWTAHR